MATTNHPESAHDEARMPAEAQVQDGQIVSGEAQGAEQDASRVPEERTLRVVVQVEVQEPRQQMSFQRITVVSEAVRDVIHIIGGSRGAEAGDLCSKAVQA